MTLAFIIFDPMFIILVLIPGMVLSGLASLWVKSAFAKNEKLRAISGYNGFQAARIILDANGLQHVGIERASGHLSDHYDPSKRVLRLSPRVHDGVSLSALGVAAHEAGHAIQHANRYAPLVLRNFVVPAASFGSFASYFIIIAGLILSFQPLALLGVGLFGIVLFFQLVNLPCEFNASSRARKLLLGLGIVSGQEDKNVGSVLNAAAMTYVAGVVTSLLTLAYYLLLIFGSSNDE